MDISEKPALAQAISHLMARTGCTIPKNIESDYLKGSARALAAYEKVDTPMASLPALVRYAIVARSYLAQPNADCFYDIFRCARFIPLLRVLDRAVTILDTRSPRGLEDRVNRLAANRESDGFEASLFELVTAAAYARLADSGTLEFIPENTDGAKPDFSVHLAETTFVECKKFDRTTDYHAELREEMRSKLHPILHKFHSLRRAVRVELTIHGDPTVLATQELETACLDSFRRGGAVICPTYTLLVCPIPSPDCSTSWLYPSPKWFKERYDYTANGSWDGLVQAISATFRGPSFLDEVDWDSAILWRVLESEATWKRKRIGYARLFKGLDQLASRGTHTALHACFERENSIGHRQAELRRFVNEAELKGKHATWLVFNELAIGVSAGGRFDFTEHSHYLGQGTAPPVIAVFSGDEDIKGSSEADRDWGVGVALPAIDEEG
ncbi:MAG: hypothetical protein HY901_23015 [Deltaproteobacteria bacterium]|nr:hypothetical protein [Deltaproteobacteria bacterium]